MKRHTPRYESIKQISTRHPGFTPDAIRGLVFRKDSNGLSPYIRKVGRRVLIDGIGFDAWIDGGTAA